MNFRDYEKYTLNEEHRRMFQLMGATPQPLNEEAISDGMDPLKRCDGANISGMIEELENEVGYGNDGTDEEGVFNFLKNHTYEDLVCMDPYFKDKGFEGTVSYIFDDFMGPLDSNNDAIKLARMLANLMKGKFGEDKAYQMVREMGGPDLYKDPDTGKYGWYSGSFQEGYTPQPLNEQRSKYKQGRNKVKVKPGKGDKDYKLVVTKDYQFDPNNLSSSDMAFKIIKDHLPIASAHPDLSPEQLIFSTRKDGRRRDVFTFMIVDKQLPSEEKEEMRIEIDNILVPGDVEKAEKEAEKEDGVTQPDPATETNTESRICNLRGDKTWEYKVEDEMWYTRKQGSTRWIKLFGDKYIKARCKLDKGCPGFRKTKEQNCSPQKLGLDDKPISGDGDTPRDQDLPKDTKYSQGFPLIEGCTTQIEGTAGKFTGSKCQVVPATVPEGMAGIAMVTYFFNPDTQKCDIIGMGGGGPFTNMEECKKCCEGWKR